VLFIDTGAVVGGTDTEEVGKSLANSSMVEEEEEEGVSWSR
jgi:hypothetical protein